MWRIFFYILIAIAITLGAVYLVDFLPGYLHLSIGNRDITLPYAMALVLIVAAIIAVVVVDRIIRWFLGFSLFSSKKRMAKRKDKSYQAIQRGLVAITAGNTKEALKQARRAENIDAENALTQILGAQAALSSQDYEEAKKRYTELLKDSQTQLIGYRGLYSLALSEGEHDEALTLIKRAYELHPASPWAYQSLFEQHIHKREFAEALQMLRFGMKKSHISQKKGKHLNAVLNAELARLSNEKEDFSAALTYAQKAYKTDNMFTPATLELIKAHMGQNAQSSAEKLIQKLWKQEPRADIIAQWEDIHKSDAIEAKFKAATKLYNINPSHEESRIFMAEMALKCNALSVAQEQLDALSAEHPVPQQRTLRLMAELEDKDESKQDPEKIRTFLLQMGNARYAPTWICDATKLTYPSWQAVSPMGKLGSLSWREPSRDDVQQELSFDATQTVELSDGDVPMLIIDAQAQNVSDSDENA